VVGAVALFRVPDAAGRGRVETGAGGRVERFVEKDPAHQGPAWVNGGLYAFAPELWRHLPRPSAGQPIQAFSLERDVLPALAGAGLLLGYEVGGEFFDIGTPEDWERAERRFGS
jgi:NDP-sugar pyrophosphorylase family protein